MEEFQICAGIGPADDSQQLIGNIEEEESEWTRRLEKVEGGFKGKRKDHETSSVESFSLAGDRKCQLCLNLVAEFIKCQTCCLFYCAQCDQSIHKHLIFHNRLGKHRHDRNGNSSSFFRQHEFLSLTGWIIKIGKDFISDQFTCALFVIYSLWLFFFRCVRSMLPSCYMPRLPMFKHARH